MTNWDKKIEGTGQIYMKSRGKAQVNLSNWCRHKEKHKETNKHIQH